MYKDAFRSITLTRPHAPFSTFNAVSVPGGQSAGGIGGSGQYVRGGLPIQKLPLFALMACRWMGLPE